MKKVSIFFFKLIVFKSGLTVMPIYFSLHKNNSTYLNLYVQVFHEMVNAGIEPSIHTYGALIDGCARGGQVAKAFGVYGIMRSKVLFVCIKR
jgi:pentatricopeptide repeat protein